MAPAIFLVCLVSAYRGYCQGNGNMIPTTVDEVLEVLFKVISGLIIAGLLVKAGYDLPVASAGAILGVSIGSVVSLGYMLIYKKILRILTINIIIFSIFFEQVSNEVFKYFFCFKQ